MKNEKIQTFGALDSYVGEHYLLKIVRINSLNSCLYEENNLY